MKVFDWCEDSSNDILPTVIDFDDISISYHNFKDFVNTRKQALEAYLSLQREQVIPDT